MNEAVDRSDSDSLNYEALIPCVEAQFGRSGMASALVALSDQFEEHGALGPVLLGICIVIEDDEIELVELSEGTLELL